MRGEVDGGGGRRTPRAPGAGYAEQRLGVLVVLQGMDTSAKSGTIRHVFDVVNRQGVRMRAFKTPTDDERREHFPERVRPALPARGCIGVFDRSY